MLRSSKSESSEIRNSRAAGGTNADEELARLAKALGHPLRIRIVRLLAKRTSCVCGELVDELPVAQSTVSQHLKVLKEAGLIHGSIDGPRVCYCLAPGALQRLKALVSALAGDQKDAGSAAGRACR